MKRKQSVSCVYTCDVCGNEEGMTKRYPRGGAMPTLPDVPEKWGLFVTEMYELGVCEKCMPGVEERVIALIQSIKS